MSSALATALILQCFFNVPQGGAAPAGNIPVIKVPIPVEMTESLVAKQPPVSSNSFAGETEPNREWVFGNSRDPKVASFQLLRVRLSDNLLSPSPYAARFGTVYRAESGYRFETKMSGYCKLLPADGVQQ